FFATNEDDVAEECKEERADALMALQQEISLDLNHRKVGRSMKVLLDREESKPWSVGSMVQVEIVRAEEFDLVAKPA
ncbi:MAG: hypothetical protein EBZ62_06010, partial [Sphingobacteriia bacterium]|nr:hypothetical protein [Sphingobacteriia bacterium]